ncbi:hypothetical protein NEOLI_005261, partial [Neolecta irregularis DAH-3]
MTSNSTSCIPIDQSSDSECFDLNSELVESQSTASRYNREESDASDPSPCRKRRKTTATEIWAYARGAHNQELERDDFGHKCWYCARCGQQCASLGRARTHMLRFHNVKVQNEALTPVQQAKKNTLDLIFGRQSQLQQGRDYEQERHLKSAINKEAFDEALAQLITVHNLPFQCVQWPALHSLLYSINYTA